MSDQLSRAESALSYTIGAGAVGFSQFIHNTNEVLQCLTLICGLAIVLIRLDIDWTRRKQMRNKKDDDKRN